MYAFVNGIILDGTENMEPQSGKAVLIDGKQIKAICDPEQLPTDCERIDLKGAFLLPGLINMHVHLAGNGKPQKKQRDNEKLVKTIFSNPVSAAVAEKLVAHYAKLELLSGVTTIRTVGGLKDLDTKVRDKIAQGKLLGPRILAANEGISVPHGHMAGSVARTCHNKEEALDQVMHLWAQKADLIKLMITGGVMDAKVKGEPGEMKMEPEMIEAVCEEAHRLGFKVAAHVESPEGVRTALRCGVDSIEHGAAPDEEIISLFKEKKAFLITTLSPAIPYAFFDRKISNASEVEQYNGQVVFEGIRDCSKAALANGIPVGLGNDVGCPWISQYDFWRELYWFEKYVGVSARFALYTATLRNAQRPGIDQITGSVEEGKEADLLIVENDPLQDLTALKQPKYVVARGRLIKDPSYKRRADVEEELGKVMRAEKA